MLKASRKDPGASQEDMNARQTSRGAKKAANPPHLGPGATAGSAGIL